MISSTRSMDTYMSLLVCSERMMVPLDGDRHLDLLALLLNAQSNSDLCFRSEVPFKLSQFLFDRL